MIINVLYEEMLIWESKVDNVYCIWTQLRVC